MSTITPAVAADRQVTIPASAVGVVRDALLDRMSDLADVIQTELREHQQDDRALFDDPSWKIDALSELRGAVAALDAQQPGPDVHLDDEAALALAEFASFQAPECSTPPADALRGLADRFSVVADLADAADRRTVPLAALRAQLDRLTTTRAEVAETIESDRDGRALRAAGEERHGFGYGLEADLAQYDAQIERHERELRGLDTLLAAAGNLKEGA